MERVNTGNIITTVLITNEVHTAILGTILTGTTGTRMLLVVVHTRHREITTQTTMATTPTDLTAMATITPMDLIATATTPMDLTAMATTPMDLTAMATTPMDLTAMATTPMDLTAMVTTAVEMEDEILTAPTTPTIKNTRIATEEK